MKNTRRGLGKGLGTGYKNLAPMDSHIHSLSAKGVKSTYFIQPFNEGQELNYVETFTGTRQDAGKRQREMRDKLRNVLKQGEIKVAILNDKGDELSFNAKGQMFSMYGSKWKVVEKGKNTVLLRNNKGEGLTITKQEYDEYRPRDVYVEMPNYIYRDGKVVSKGTNRVLFGSLHYANQYIEALNPKAKKEAKIVLNAKGKRLTPADMDYNVKDIFRSLREEAKELPRTDLQGRAMVIASQIAEDFDIKPDKVVDGKTKFYWSVEETLLEYADGEIDINTAKRIILDLPKNNEKLNAKGKEYIKGGMSSGMPHNVFPKKEMKMGEKVEMEHTNNPKIAKEIARDHLAEHKDYYTQLKIAEDKMKSGVKLNAKTTILDDDYDTKEPYKSKLVDNTPLKHYKEYSKELGRRIKALSKFKAPAFKEERVMLESKKEWVDKQIKKMGDNQ